MWVYNWGKKLDSHFRFSGMATRMAQDLGLELWAIDYKDDQARSRLACALFIMEAILVVGSE